jgi:dUTP pyrophosphatase
MSYPNLSTLITNDNEYCDENNIYKLLVWLDPEHISKSLMKKYDKSFDIHNTMVTKMIFDNTNLNYINPEIHVDSGIDLHVPTMASVREHTHSNKINHGMSAAMYYGGKATAYYLYPRSSMGSKTPLRLANSVGIIDSGYRGHLIGVVDNLSPNAYTITSHDRLLQICSPNLSPIYVIRVDSLSELGKTNRNNSGFGSSGR